MSATVLKFRKPEEEPEYIKKVKERLAFLNGVQMELDRELNTYIRILNRYEEQK
jgi:hypothetical protein